MFVPTDAVSPLSARLLAQLPQQAPFRFLDRIAVCDDERIVGVHWFDPASPYYAGHFPGAPLTPGVLLLETMAQTAVVAYGIYLLTRDAGEGAPDPQLRSLFSDCTAEFLKPVFPGETVYVEGRKISWRRGRLRASAELFLADGTLAVTATLGGCAVPHLQ